MSECIADDITECDCENCYAEEIRWEHWQGWENGRTCDQEDCWCKRPEDE